MDERDEDLCDAVGAIVADLQRGLRQRLDALERRVRELEERPEVRYCGVWNPRALYKEGAMTTRAGSIWYCNRSTRNEPGKSADWTPAVKRGRNGREIYDDA